MHFSLNLLFALMLFAVGAGCKTPTSFYVLSAEGAAPNRQGGIGIGVGPVNLASYLDRKNLVMMEGGQKLLIAESHVWGGDLAEDISRVLAVNLGRGLNSGSVRSYPWQTDAGLRYEMTVDIRKFHGNNEGDAVLEAGWTVYSLPERTLVKTQTWSGTEPLEKDGYEALAAAESRLLARLADAMANNLR